MDVSTRRSEVDPFGSDSLRARVRFDVAYAGSWLLIGFVLARDGLVRARQHRRVIR